MPFAQPGLRGPVFSYGGPSPTHGSEHDGPYVSIDVETTGLSASRCRVVEIAAVRFDRQGHIEDEYATLINPQQGSVGPTEIHGITARQVRDAPTFADIVPDLFARMEGAVVVAHNATFEDSFLGAELERAGVHGLSVPAIDTLWLARATYRGLRNHRLPTIAREAGLSFYDKHAALGDARVVAALLPQMLDRLKRPYLFEVGAIPAMQASATPLRLVTRAVSLRKGSEGWMSSLVARLPQMHSVTDDAGTEAYLDMLSSVLEDGQIDKAEATALASLVGSLGMSANEVNTLNERYLDTLHTAALDDDVLTSEEVRQLSKAAKLLGHPDYFAGLTPTPVERPITVRAARSDSSYTERALEAVGLQAAGSTYAEIADVLHLSRDTVKKLLRDGKWFTDPHSDPERLALAQSATLARQQGDTMACFRAAHGLSDGKSAEAWRDAGMCLAGELPIGSTISADSSGDLDDQ